jgi:hypothetical protein
VDVASVNAIKFSNPLSLLSTIALSSKHRCCGWLLKHLLTRMEEIMNKTTTKKMKKNKKTFIEIKKNMCFYIHP